MSGLLDARLVLEGSWISYVPSRWNHNLPDCADNGVAVCCTISVVCASTELYPQTRTSMRVTRDTYESKCPLLQDRH